MWKLAGSSLALVLFGLTLGLAPMGCSDDAGGNENGVMEKTEGGKGVVAPDAPKSQQEYYQRARTANTKKK